MTFIFIFFALKY